MHCLRSSKPFRQRTSYLIIPHLNIQLVSEDPAQVCPVEVIAAEQRYILSLLYFSTNGDEWYTCNRLDSPEIKPCTSNRYLSVFDECSWMGMPSVSCDAAGRIRLLAAGMISTVLYRRSLLQFPHTHHSAPFFP